MSRIGKAPVEVPGGVNVEISGRSVKVTGPRGELSVPVGRGVEVRQENGSLVLPRAQGDARADAVSDPARRHGCHARVLEDFANRGGRLPGCAAGAEHKPAGRILAPGDGLAARGD